MLTSKQRSYLRGLANKIDPIFQIGKEGVYEENIKEIEKALNARELIKVAVLKNSLVDAREACDVICEACGADGVQVIGNKFVIYKRNEEKPKIELPKVRRSK